MRKIPLITESTPEQIKAMEECKIVTSYGEDNLKNIMTMYDMRDDFEHLITPGHSRECAKKIASLYSKARWEQSFVTQNGLVAEMEFFKSIVLQLEFYRKLLEPIGYTFKAEIDLTPR